MGGKKPLYLGFDISTQQLKAIVIDSSLRVIAGAKVDFDDDFGAKYRVTKGVHVNDSTGEVYAPVAMWLESLDLCLNRLSEQMERCGASMNHIGGISGSGQQHGSVWWNAQASELLKRLNGSESGRSLVEQLDGALAYDFSPNWQDHSTQTECDAFDDALGGRASLAEVTGSGAHHRFTGAQIMRLRRAMPEMYANTTRISLVSSWLASILLGAIAPIDVSEVCGMSLWDVPQQRYHERLLALAGGSDDGAELRRKLGEPQIDCERQLGTLSSYFVKRYGFSPGCQIIPFTGDNPATILSLPLRPLDAIVSLGTSTTFIMNTPTYKPDESYHFFNHPTTKGNYMFMLCYKNGGLAREKIRDRIPKAAKYGADGWEDFNKAIVEAPPLGMKASDDSAKLGLYFSLRETVPNVRAGTWRFNCDPDGNHLRQSSTTWSANVDARIIVESQALSLRLRSQKLVHSPKVGLPAQPRCIYLVGGGSLNPAIAQVIGDVLGGSEGVYKLDVGGNACALGGAHKAVWAVERRENETFDELIGKRWKEEEAMEKVDRGYKNGVYEMYGNVLGAFEELEKMVRREEQRS